MSPERVRRYCEGRASKAAVDLYAQCSEVAGDFRVEVSARRLRYLVLPSHEWILTWRASVCGVEYAMSMPICSGEREPTAYAGWCCARFLLGQALEDLRRVSGRLN